MIKAGNNLPDGAVMVMEDAAPKKISVSELLGDKKSIIFGVPGAFTPLVRLNIYQGLPQNMKTLLN